MQKRWMILAAVAVLTAGISMARPTPQASNSFLGKLTVGMPISVTQKDDLQAVVYIPTKAEAAGGDFFKVTEVGSDYFQCQSGTAIWRVPSSAIARICWNAEG